MITVEEQNVPTITRAFGDDAKAACLEVLSDVEWWATDEIRQEAGNDMAAILNALESLEDMGIVQSGETVRGPSWRLNVNTRIGHHIALMVQEDC